MSTPETADNPYAATLEPATGRVVHEQLLDVECRTNLGSTLWSNCRFIVDSNQIEMKFLFQDFTLPIERVKLLRSAGKGISRHLEIVHVEPMTPEKISLIPLYPASWYDVFESLGIPTEDETKLRSAKQLYYIWSERLMLLEPFTIPIIVVVLMIYGLITDFFR